MKRAKRAVWLSLQNIGWFTNPYYSKSKDRIINDGKNIKRSDAKNRYIDIPKGELDYRHIANILRCLCHDRPIPLFRKVCYNTSPWYTEVAKKALVKINTPICQRYGRDSYPCEIISTQKSISTSYSTAKENYFLDGQNTLLRGGIIDWPILYRCLDFDLFKEFIKVVTYFKNDNPFEYSPKKLIEFLNTKKHHNEVKKLCANIRDNGKAGAGTISNMIENKKVGKCVTPKKLKDKIGKRQYTIFNKLLKQYCGKTLSDDYSTSNAVFDLSKYIKKNEEVFNICSFINDKFADNMSISIHCSPSTPDNILLVNNGIETIEVFDAEVVVPVNPQDLKKFKLEQCDFGDKGIVKITDITLWSQNIAIWGKKAIEAKLFER